MNLHPSALPRYTMTSIITFPFSTFAPSPPGSFRQRRCHRAAACDAPILDSSMTRPKVLSVGSCEGGALLVIMVITDITSLRNPYDYRDWDL